MEQRQRTPRHRTLKAGSIEFGGGAIDCTMRNIPQTGAALDVESPLGIPEKFTLIVPTENLRWNCRVGEKGKDRETDKSRAAVLNLIADEAERGVLVTSERSNSTLFVQQPEGQQSYRPSFQYQNGTPQGAA